nr:MAG TPA: hypothetical protein [Caudoviricetes sp.]
MARYNVDLQDNEGNAYQIMANPDSVAEFSPAVNRENIRSGETYRVIFGKIMKYLSEVGNAAYVGLANNCTTTIAGFALDARQGKELMDRINELNRELGTGGGEMSLKSMVSELYGKLANFDLVVDISKYFSTNTAQIFEVKSSADLSGYEYIAICATFQKGKSGNFTEIAGCEILDQLGWNHLTSSDEVAIHLVILKNITGAISILGRYAGTGSATVKAFGFK